MFSNIFTSKRENIKSNIWNRITKKEINADYIRGLIISDKYEEIDQLLLTKFRDVKERDNQTRILARKIYNEMESYIEEHLKNELDRLNKKKEELRRFKAEKEIFVQKESEARRNINEYVIFEPEYRNFLASGIKLYKEVLTFYRSSPIYNLLNKIISICYKKPERTPFYIRGIFVCNTLYELASDSFSTLRNLYTKNLQAEMIELEDLEVEHLFESGSINQPGNPGGYVIRTIKGGRKKTRCKKYKCIRKSCKKRSIEWLLT